MAATQVVSPFSGKVAGRRHRGSSTGAGFHGGDHGHSHAPCAVSVAGGRKRRRELLSGRLSVINTPIGQELISELNSFEVDFNVGRERER
jgi:hypothetical protein